MDDDPFGLRRMIQSGPIQPGPGVVGGHHTEPPPGSGGGGMFGPIIGPPDYSHHQPIGKSVSATNIGEYSPGDG